MTKNAKTSPETAAERKRRQRASLTEEQKAKEREADRARKQAKRALAVSKKLEDKEANFRQGCLKKMEAESLSFATGACCKW